VTINKVESNQYVARRSSIRDARTHDYEPSSNVVFQAPKLCRCQCPQPPALLHWFFEIAVVFSFQNTVYDGVFSFDKSAARHKAIALTLSTVSVRELPSTLALQVQTPWLVLATAIDRASAGLMLLPSSFDGRVSKWLRAPASCCSSCCRDRTSDRRSDLLRVSTKALKLEGLVNGPFHRTSGSNSTPQRDGKLSRTRVGEVLLGFVRQT